jgi:hypothetical protein
MDADFFYECHRLIKKYMKKKRSHNNKKKKNSGKNGRISTVMRLSVAL